MKQENTALNETTPQRNLPPQPKKRKNNAVVVTLCIAFVIGLIACAVIYYFFGGSTPTMGKPETPTDAAYAGGTLTTDGTEDGETTQPTVKEHEPTVILDAGHGFADVGCAGPESALGQWEKDMTLDMVKSLRDSFESRGVRVLLTHDGDTYPSLDELTALCRRTGTEYDASKDTWADDGKFSPYERAIYMNCLAASEGADLALSIHVNSIENKDRSGFDLDYCAQNTSSAQSKVFADTLRAALAADYPGRDMHFFADSWDDAFIVTKYTLLPSMLLETGYYTNEEDVALLRDASWRARLMDNVAEALSPLIKGK